MLSRVADNIYWMCRYIERAENVARFIDVNHNMTLGEEAALSGQWAPLVHTTGDDEAFQQRYGAATRENVIQFLGFDAENANSILSCVNKARENARTVREVISSTMWEEINKFYYMVRSAGQFRAVLDQPYEFCGRVKLASHLLVGVTDATMSHGEAWHFGRIGRLIERADKTSRLVDVQYYVLLPKPQDVGSSLDVVRWSALLKSASALAMYRRLHGRITPDNVADFLILDRDFPRAMHFCLIKAHESLQQITGSASGTFRNPSEKHMGRLRAEMDYATIGDIIKRGLHEFIDQFQQELNLVAHAIYKDFFTLEPKPEDSPAPSSPAPSSLAPAASSQVQSSELS